MVKIDGAVWVAGIGDLVGEITVRIEQGKVVIPRHERGKQRGLPRPRPADDVGVCAHSSPPEPWREVVPLTSLGGRWGRVSTLAL